MTGSIQIYGSDCVTGGQLDATVHGDQVQFGAIQAGHSHHVPGRDQGRHAWRACGPSTRRCGGWSGTWQATISQGRTAEVAHRLRRAMPSRLVSSMPASYAETRAAIESGLIFSTTCRTVSGEAPWSR